MKKYIAYYWSSTPVQAESGFGLQAQQDSVRNFLQNKGELTAEYSGVGGIKEYDRPELDAAIAHARITGSTLIVDKLNRVSRDSSFIADLRQSGLDVVAVQMDSLDNFFTS